MPGKDNAEEKRGGISPGTLWAYGYEIIPPVGDDLMKEIGSLLSEEHENAIRTKRVWAGKLVREQRVTHIMVVSDSPDQAGEVDHRIKSGLERLKAAYCLSAPMAVAGDDPAQPPTPDLPPGQDP